MRVLFLIPIFLLACTGNSTQTENNSTNDKSGVSKTEETVTRNTDNKPPGTIPPADGNCYWQILQRDTFVASFSSMGDQVSGKLTFDNFEKDGSSGKVAGKTEDGIIKLWYSFQSEGMNSVMEVWFKKDGDNLLRGTGDMGMRGDTSYFSKPATVKFGGSQDLKKINCSDVPSKYR